MESWNEEELEDNTQRQRKVERRPYIFVSFGTVHPKRDKSITEWLIGVMAKAKVGYDSNDQLRDGNDIGIQSIYAIEWIGMSNNQPIDVGGHRLTMYLESIIVRHKNCKVREANYPSINWRWRRALMKERRHVIYIVIYVTAQATEIELHLRSNSAATTTLWWDSWWTASKLFYNQWEL